MDGCFHVWQYLDTYTYLARNLHGCMCMDGFLGVVVCFTTFGRLFHPEKLVHGWIWSNKIAT